ncbi:MAG: flagellar hook-length control protein FliK [Beijerinckiaceae bacterium]
MSLAQAVTDMLPARPAPDAKRRAAPPAEAKGFNDILREAEARPERDIPQTHGRPETKGNGEPLHERGPQGAERRSERGSERAGPPESRAAKAERRGHQREAAPTEPESTPDETPAEGAAAAAAVTEAAPTETKPATETADAGTTQAATETAQIAAILTPPVEALPTLAPAAGEALAPEATAAPAVAPQPAVAALPLPEQSAAVAAAAATPVAQAPSTAATETAPAAVTASAAPVIAAAGDKPNSDEALTEALPEGAASIAKPGKGEPGKPETNPAEAARAEAGTEPGKPSLRSEFGQAVAAQAHAMAAARKDAPSVEGAKPGMDPVAGLTAPQGVQPTSSSPAAPAATPQQAMARADAPVPLQALAVEIGMRAMRGSKEFQIRLDPEDLGRIDVRLEISEKGEVQARVIVERVETLQLLQRDAKTLERAFDQAGLKTNPEGLQFQLSDGRNGQRHGERADDAPDQRGRGRNDGAPADDLPLVSAVYRAPAQGALDIRI